MPLRHITWSLCLIALLLPAAVARADDTTAPATQPAEDRPRPQVDPTTLIERLREQMSTMTLTDDQKQKVDDEMNKAEHSLKLLDQDLQNATDQKKGDRIRAILVDLREKIHSLLTPEQQQELRQKITSNARNRLQRLRAGLATLGLSDDQKQKIKDLLDGAQTKLEHPQENAAEDKKDTSEKLRTAAAEIRQKLADILTDDQRLQLRDYLENSAAPTTQPQPAN